MWIWKEMRAVRTAGAAVLVNRDIYMSCTIQCRACNAVYTDIESADNYDNIYQSDLCGWGGQEE